jgi:preprotein translocase subunit SecG
MYILFLLVHVVVCVFLIIVVLLQSGKAADLAGAFGGMGSQTAFGPRGSATLLSKATTISAVLFMVTSLSLSILATRNAGLGTTVLEDQQQQQQKKGPVQSIPVQIPGQQQEQPAGPPMRIPLPPPGTPPPPGAPGAPAPAQSAPVQSAPAQPAPVKK